MKKLCLTLFVLFFSQSGLAESSKDRKFKFIKDVETIIKDPFLLRDPFIKKKVTIKSNKKKKKKFGTSLSNRPTLEIEELKNLAIVGIFLGKDRRALAKIVSKTGGVDGKTNFEAEVYTLKEGMILGKNKAEVKAILPGGVVLVEKIRNVYEQTELLETILPLYQP